MFLTKLRDVTEKWTSNKALKQPLLVWVKGVSFSLFVVYIGL